MMIAAQVPSNPVVGVLVALVLFGLGRSIIHWVARAEQNPWLVRILTWSLILHLLCAPAQIVVVDHVYHGIADYTRYTDQGVGVASNFHHLDFTTAGTKVGKIVNDGSVSIATGIVMTIVGPDELAAFLVFAFLSFLAGVLYYRAFTLTFEGAGHRRYGYFIFLFPSILFWTGDSSKEAIMFVALSLCAYGTAKVFRRRRGGFTLLAPGVLLGVLVRPNELVLLLGGFAVATTVVLVGGHGSSIARRIAGFAAAGVFLIFSLYLTQHYLVKAGSLTGQLQASYAANTLTAYGGASGGIPYSSSPVTFPRDVYEVLFNPLPYNAHDSSELIGAAENTLLLVLILKSLRQLRIVIRASFARPYVMLCLIYSAGFFYTGAALGNLGLIERERVLLLPFFLVLLSIPRGPKESPPAYEWELKRKDRQRFRSVFDRTGGRVPTPLIPFSDSSKSRRKLR